MSIATVTSKGQVTLPKELREKLHITTGQKIDFRIDEKAATAVLVPLNRKVDDVYGILKRGDRKAVTTEEMDAAIKTGIRKKHTILHSAVEPRRSA